MIGKNNITQRLKRLISFALIFTIMLGLFSLIPAMPVSANTYNGTCGASLTWTLDTATGVLEISGTGDMTNWSSGSVPWFNYRQNVKTVIVADGVTSIGDYAFYYCSSLMDVTIPDSVTSIGEGAFYGCSGLTSVTIPFLNVILSQICSIIKL